MKILITGATGFIGQRLLLQTSAADEVFVVCRKPLTGLPAHVSVIEADLNEPAGLLDRLKVIRPDVCVHLAWEGIPDFGYNMSLKNLQHGSALLRCLVEECGCRKIVMAGSCLEYGKTFGPCHENEAITLDSYFVWAKHALYNLGRLLASKYNVSFIWFRLFYVYGPGQRAGSLIPMMADALKKNEHPLVKTPHNANDFIHVDDIAEALMLMVHKDVPTGIYNLGSGRSVPVWKVCEHLERAMGRELFCSKRLREAQVQPTADFWADMSKTTHALGWSPKIDIEEGLRRYVKTTEIHVK